MSKQEDQRTWGAAVVAIVVTAGLALGLGWVVAALFGEPPAERWPRAIGLAVSVTVIAMVTPWIRRRQSRRETSRGSVLTGLRLVEGAVPGLGTGWKMGKAAVVSGRVDFVRGRFPFQRRSAAIVTFAVAGHSEPRDSTLRESLRIGTDARVVDLVTTAGARVRLAAILPASMASVLAALDA